MKITPTSFITRTLLSVMVLSVMALSVFAASVELTMRHVIAGEPLQLGSTRYETSARESFSVTRLSYLLSNFAFQREDGSWLELPDSVAWFDAEKERCSTRFEVSDGTYRSIRFHVGLATNLNHADVAKFDANHPLNPNVNGLHWSWQGGYVFMAVEGMWRNHGALDGWSYHLARDTNRVAVTLAADIKLTNAAAVSLDFDLRALFNLPRAISFAKDGSSTHSRDGDPVAAALVANLPGAFRLRSVTEIQSPVAPNTVAKPIDMPEKFSPYRFELSAMFPIPELPRDNPLIEERITLGEKLFHELLLSRDATISCASCHDAKDAFADRRRFSIGVSNRPGTRNAMPLFNLAWKSSFFWDGRAGSLRAQTLMPIQDHAEMDEALTNVVAKLKCAANDNASYRALFARAFASPEITAEKIGLALEQFVLTLTSFDSRFDRAVRGEAQLSADEKRGFKLFMTEYDPRRQQFGADCFHCHGGPLFQSQTFANNGLDSVFGDPGRAGVTGKNSDAGKFATPSLRNVALTAPYMHDGRFSTLEEVIEHYSSGVKRSATLDPNIAKHPDGGLHLSSEDKQALVAFLKTLTDEKYLTPAVATISASR
jgi:cytochrome c peroxidase